MDDDPAKSSLDSNLETQSTYLSTGLDATRRQTRFQLLRFNRTAFIFIVLTLVIMLLLGAGGFLLSKKANKIDSQAAAGKAANFSVSDLSLQGLGGTDQLQLSKAQSLAINGELHVNGGLILQPTDAPTTGQAGQLYFDKTTNQPYFYNGTAFVSLVPPTVPVTPKVSVPISVSSLGGQTGAIDLGNGLQVLNGRLQLSSNILQAVAAVGGTLTVATGITVSSFGVGIVQSNASGVLTSGALDRNNASYFNTTLTVGNGGTGATTLAANGLLYGNGTGAVQATAAAANSILATNGSNVPGLTQTLPTAVQGNITSTGALATGSITTGFGNITTANIISTTGVLQGGTVNATSGIQLNGTNINTPGTLSNVAYQNQANIFTAAQTINGTLAVSAGAGIVGTFSGRVSGANAVSNNEFATLGQITALGAGSYVANGTFIQANTNFNIQAVNNGSTGTIGGIIRGAAGGQTADLLQLQNSVGTIVASVNATGSITAPAFTGSFKGTNTGTPTDVQFATQLNGAARAYILAGGDAGFATVQSSTFISNSGTASNKAFVAQVNGTTQGYIQNDGGAQLQYLGVGTTPLSGTKINITTGSATNIGIVIMGATSQSADLQQFVSSTGAVLSRFDANGNLAIGVNAPAYKLDVQGGTGIVGQFSGRVIGANAVNSNEFATLSQVTGAVSGASNNYIANGIGLQTAANFNIQSASATSVGGIIRAAAGQTANILQLQDATGTNLVTLDAGGTFNVNGYFNTQHFTANAGSQNNFGAGGNNSTLLSVSSINPNVIGLAVKGASGQIIDLQQFQNVSGTVLSGVDASGNVYLNAGQSLKVNGSSAFPASPTEGQIYYRTDTKQLYVYANGKWQADRSTASVIVAAGNTPNKEKADFVGDGTNDQNAINAAIASLPATGGSVVLLDGTYNVAAPITFNKTKSTLQGQGTSTILKRMYNEAAAGSGILVMSTANSTVTQLYFDGNKASYTNTNNNSVYSDPGCIALNKNTFTNLTLFDSAGFGMAITGGACLANSYQTISNNYISGSGSTGLQLAYLRDSTITNNTIIGGSANGLHTDGSARNTFTGNRISSNAGTGIALDSGIEDSIFANNIIKSNNVGISLSYIGYDPVGPSIVNNVISSNATGLLLGDYSDALVSGNSIVNNTGVGLYVSNAAFVATISNNSLSNNGTNLQDLSVKQNYVNQSDNGSNILISGIAGVGINTLTPTASLQNAGAFVNGALAAPAAPTVTNQGTAGPTSYTYAVTAFDGLGETIASTGTATTTSNATLSATNYNQITPSRVAGAVSYRIYRTASSGSPATTGLIGSVAGGASSFLLNDTGLAATTAAPAINTTGGASIAGALSTGGLATFNGGLTVATGQNLTVNGTAFNNLLGSGLSVVSGALTIDSSSTTGFFRNGGNSFGATATLGTNDNYSLNFKTNNTNRLTIDVNGNASITTGVLAVGGTGVSTFTGSQTTAGLATFNGGLIARGNGTNLFKVRNSSGAIDVLTVDDQGNLTLGTNTNNGNITSTGSGSFGGTLTTTGLTTLSGGATVTGTTAVTGATTINTTGTATTTIGNTTGTTAVNINAGTGNINLGGNTTATGTVTVQGTGSSSFVGNLGIGTTTPGYKLDVQAGTGIVANFSGRVAGANAVANNEFVTLGQTQTGFIQNGLTTQASANFNIQATSSTTVGTVGGVIRGANGGQTADLLQLQSSSGSISTRFNAGGALIVNLTQPNIPSISTSTTGGTLPAGTYYYKITALDPAGNQTTPSTEVSITTTGSTSTVALSSFSVNGSQTFIVYRGTTPNSENVYYQFTNNTGSFTDTGAASTAGTPPIVNSAIYSSFANSGTSIAGGTVSGINNTAIGLRANAFGQNGVAIGADSSASSTQSVAILGTASNVGAIAIGGNASGRNSVAFQGATSSGTDSLAFGTSAVSSGIGSITLQTNRNSVASGIQNTTNYSFQAGVNTNSNSATSYTRGGNAYVGTGTVATTSSSNVVTGTGTTFTNDFIVGDRITIGAETSSISAISSATSLTVSGTFATTNAAGTTFSVLPAIFRLQDASGAQKLFVNDQGGTTITANVNSGDTLFSVKNAAGTKFFGVNWDGITDSSFGYRISNGGLFIGGLLQLVGNASILNATANGAISISSNGTGALSLDSGTTGAINIGTTANAKILTVGNTTGATAVNINAGTGNINLGGNTTATGTVTVQGTGSSSFVGNLGIGTTTPTQKLEVAGNIQLDQVAAPATAPTAAINATAGTLTGAYSYRVSYVTTSGETETGPASNSVSPTAQQINLTAIPISANPAVTARKLYRTTSYGGNTQMQLVTTIANNTTTTYTDNLADTSLGAFENRVNTTGGILYNGTSKALVVDNATTAVGLGALSVNTGYYNTAVGISALQANTTGSWNTALGAQALQANTTGFNNTATGAQALQSNTTGSWNTASGFGALTSNTTGYQNTATGFQALQLNTTSSNNTATGFQALQLNATGSNNTATGHASLQQNVTGANNTATGNYALQSNKSGGNNTASGLYALGANSTGGNNTAYGAYALQSNLSGNNNTTSGFAALQNNTGSNNTSFGYNSLQQNTTGANNTALGFNAGYNTAVALATNNNSVFIGQGANTSVDGLTNVVALGYNAQATQSNQVVIGNSSITQTLLQGGVLVKTATNNAIAFSVQSSTAAVGLIVSTNNLAVAYNAANATLKVGADSVTLRSINAAGSINANGADYAEYIPWSGTKPATGSIVNYKGSNYVVSSKETAAFVGNDKFNDTDSILVTFAGQVPVRVTGSVAVGDILIANGDGTARAITPGVATIGQLLAKIAIAQEANQNPAVKLVNASIGTTSDSVASALQNQSGDFANIAVQGNAKLNNATISGTALVANLNVSGAATLASLTVSGDTTITGTLTVASIAVSDITVSGHIITAGGQPVGTVTTAAGDQATITVTGTDTTGTITITTGKIPVAGELSKITFSKAYATAPRIVLSPSNDHASELGYYKGTTDVNGFVLNSRTVPAANTTYVFDYFIAQ